MSPGRRHALGAMLAFFGLARAAAATVHPDAELKRLAAEYLDTRRAMLEAEQRDPHPGASRGYVALLAHMHGRVAAIRAVTVEGLTAKARIIEAHWGDAPAPGEDGAVAWSIVCDLLGRPA